MEDIKILGSFSLLGVLLRAWLSASGIVMKRHLEHSCCIGSSKIRKPLSTIERPLHLDE